MPAFPAFLYIAMDRAKEDHPPVKTINGRRGLGGNVRGKGEKRARASEAFASLCGRVPHFKSRVGFNSYLILEIYRKI